MGIPHYERMKSMRIYRADNSFGCLIGLLFLFFFFYMLIFFSKLLFTTPLGLALVSTFGLWYWFEGRRRARRTGGGMYEFQGREPEPERERENPFEEKEGSGINKEDVVDVTHYEEVKDDE